ncbi:MarR family transcriptional regulator [Mycetocola spongiae]|uniref:MarR family transcriptional regulator n=1 Tax=Mycetocola spongiae TaxID=2859226 RepID=UPI001CF2D4C4|nr:MarR family transcriptional regulator [Mycetocola spongiae]UCR88429.1 MarR family transcriptional regulator [Mycetocola spongiae]
MEPALNPHDLADLADLIVTVAREITLHRDGETPNITLTSSAGNVMRYIDRNPGSTAGAVALGTGLHRANLSTALGELEQLAFVRRERDENDRRNIRLYPTATSAKNLVHLREEWAQLIADALAPAETSAPVATATVGDTLALLERLETGLLRRRGIGTE